MTMRAAVLFSMCLASPALAEDTARPIMRFIDGNKLHESCITLDFAAANTCTAYITGVADVLYNDAVADIRACIPLGVNTTQVEDIVKQYLAANPQNRHLTAASLIAIALSDAFPC